ncbi:hypothetical protein PI87_02860 [Ralstonia sp. A12]|uniref:DUF4339 domain-containing protein n=1 Tax=Ralstonia sp. A12 TaxID=1217052 RepID=UPI0005731B2D|nr:DUF4339 domain-containing protein [Ralstonia sp. A12]KHK59005.1 hypothetical protein PI87_02860 [Ralstonia sp. A12]
MNNAWYYEKNGQRLGGLPEAEVVGLIAQHALTAETLVWKQGLATWTPLAQTELAAHLASADLPPTLPATHVSNLVVWFIAAAPLIGSFLQGVLAYVVAGNEWMAQRALASGRYWWVTVLLNVGLCIVDERRLKVAGVDTSTFGKLVFIVPVYLWKRATSLKQRPAYFWTWIGVFVLNLLSAL